MAITNYYIERAKDSEMVRILLFLTDKGKKFKFPFSQKIQEKYWNSKKQRAKPNYLGCVEFNRALDNFEEQVKQIYNDAKAQNIIVTHTYLKTKLEENDESSKKVAIIVSKAEAVQLEKKKTFWEVLDQFIESITTTRTVATLKVYKTVRNHLKVFKKKTHYNISFDNINHIFRDKFYHFLITDLRLGPTTVQKYFKTLKTFLNYATEYEHNTSQEYKKFNYNRAEVIKVALSESELNAIKALDFTGNTRLERVRDMFLFMCVTSLRYSDMQALKPFNIQSMNLDGQEIFYLDLLAQKTRGEIQSPLSDFALNIIRKYGNGKIAYSFPRITNQKFNEYIKEIAQLAQINEKVVITKFIGMQRIETEHFKYELVSCHTARRTFVTQFFERGGNSAACMVFTGHKDPSELETYRKKTLQHKFKLVKDLSLVPLA